MALKAKHHWGRLELEDVLRVLKSAPTTGPDYRPFLPTTEAEAVDILAAALDGRTMYKYYVCPNPCCNALFRLGMRDALR